ncbi:TPA: hypothetical protein KD866_002410 [Vibrio parahaemolyticus]|nr:hypothetical protein [Vibrio parahaemolyticus]
MATIEKRQASGSIELSYEWEESSSGHVEDKQFTKLTGDKLKVTMIDYKSHKPVGKRSSIKRQEYSISVAKLIELIKEHGEKVK